MAEGGLLRYEKVKADGITKAGALSQTLACFLLEELKIHRSLVARVELVLVKLTAVGTLRLR